MPSATGPQRSRRPFSQQIRIERVHCDVDPLSLGDSLKLFDKLISTIEVAGYNPFTPLVFCFRFKRPSLKDCVRFMERADGFNNAFRSEQFDGDLLLDRFVPFAFAFELR
mgnify:CR=1 FL=1